MSPAEYSHIRIKKDTLDLVRRYVGQQYAQGKTIKDISIEGFVDAAVREKLTKPERGE